MRKLSHYYGAFMSMVTVGMPIYNRSGFLLETLDNLRAQTFKDFSLIISDNASPNPRIAEICKIAAKADARISYNRQLSNIGAAANFIYVFDHADTEYFMWASDDDLRNPTFIERGVTALSKSDAGAWFCQIENINREGGRFRSYPSFRRFASTRRKWIDLARFLWEPEVMGKANLFYSMFRREQLAPVVDLFRQSFNGWGSDMVFVYGFLCRNDLLIDDGIFMQKRVDADGTWMPDVPRRYIYPWPEREAYFENYRRVARDTRYSTLTDLILAVRYRYDRWIHTSKLNLPVSI